MFIVLHTKAGDAARNVRATAVHLPARWPCGDQMVICMGVCVCVPVERGGAIDVVLPV